MDKQGQCQVRRLSPFSSLPPELNPSLSSGPGLTASSVTPQAGYSPTPGVGVI